jgi:hypothetical protein
MKASARYAAFLADKEWKRHDTKWSLVPTYEKPMRVKFIGTRAFTSEADLADGWVPLATIGSEESQFLAVRSTDDACPVAMWEHETGKLVACAESLDAFLAALGATARDATEPATAYDIAKLRSLANEVEKLVDARASKKRDAALAPKVVELQALLAQRPETLTGDDASAADMANYRVGQAMRALKRFREAVEIFRQPGVAQDSAVDLLVNELDDAPLAITICEAHTDPSPVMRRGWALALFRLGRFDEARVQLRIVVQRQVDSTLKLYPKKDRAAETKQRTRVLAETVETFAAKYALDVTRLALTS